MDEQTVTRMNRRTLLKNSSLALTSVVFPLSAAASSIDLTPVQGRQNLIHLNLNENAYGPSPSVARAIQEQLAQISRYADSVSAATFAEQIAAYERVPIEQIVLGEILGDLGLYLGGKGCPGGEFVYSTPGYLALVDAASRVGGVGVPVPLDKDYKNDLSELTSHVNAKTRALYLINPHNPTGTVNDDASFKTFLREVSQRALIIVDEAYLEFTPDFERRSAVSLVRDGANVSVFRTFDKIHGLAGMPIGYSIVPRALGNALRKEGIGDAEGLGRLNIAAASAALADTAHVRQVRSTITSERTKWVALLDSLNLRHTDSQANFVFFDARRPQQELATAMRNEGVDISRTFPPYTTWARITIGLPDENHVAQQLLQKIIQQ
jgi:histidinol-phosphate aminotransferase